eukprot:sb/3468965/
MKLPFNYSPPSPPPSPPSSPSSLFSLRNVRSSGGRTLVLTDSLSKFKADSISKNGLFIYNIESAFFRLFRHRVLIEFRLIWTLYLNLNLDIESTVDLECSTRVRPPDRAQSCATSISRRHPCGQNTYVDIESAFFRLFRHRVLIEFRLIWTLYLNLNLDIESTVDLECSTRVRPPDRAQSCATSISRRHPCFEIYKYREDTSVANCEELSAQSSDHDSSRTRRRIGSGQCSDRGGESGMGSV